MRRDIDRLTTQSFDVAIIGGGIHGAWIALRAQQSGLRVALIEKNDFGAATSANSLKILHGGLRYLQHLDLKRMRHSIAARREFGRLSPHLVRPLPCVMPLQAMGIRSPWILGPALLANEVMSMDRNSGVAAQARVPAGHLLGTNRCKSAIAPLSAVDAFAGAQWWDAIALHAGRLVLEPLMLAEQGGAAIANRVEATAYLSHEGVVKGVIARDVDSGREFQIQATTVIDAAGPWAGQLSLAQGLPSTFLPRSWLVGVNLLFKRSLGIDAGVALTSTSRSADSSALLRRTSRELFFVPWQGITMVGTDYHEASTLSEARAPSLPMVESFLAEAARIAPQARLTLDDVALVHWGILPAEASSASVPRKSPILAAHRGDTGLDGLIVVMAEKLTSAPTLSLTVLDAVRSRATPSMQVAAAVGPEVMDSGDIRLQQRYGHSWQQAAQLLRDQPELAATIDGTTDTQKVEVVHAIRNEMARSLADVVLRRLSIAQKGHPGMQALRACADIVAAELDIGAEAMQKQVTALDRDLNSYLLPATGRRRADEIG